MNFDDTCFNWVQIVKKSEIPANAKYLALYLGTFMNHEQDIAWPSMERISYETGLAKNTCRKWIGWLHDNKWLSVARNSKPHHGPGGIQYHNQYQICLPDLIKRGVEKLPPSLKGGANDEQRGVNERPKGGREMTPNNNRITINNNRRFKPPTLKEVGEYCESRNNGIDPQNFIDHYETNGWMRGKNKIKDWKACVRTWEKNNKPKPDYDPLEDWV